jgi:hypothetical protein
VDFLVGIVDDVLRFSIILTPFFVGRSLSFEKQNNLHPIILSTLALSEH